MRQIEVRAKSVVRNIPPISHIFGEKAGLRSIDLDSKEDLLCIREIEDNPKIDFIGGTTSSVSSLKRIVRNIHRSSGHKIYAVTTCDDCPGNSRGDVEGWIKTHETSEESDRYKRIMEIDKETPCDVVEVVYIRRESPNMVRGLMSSALRQVLFTYFQRIIESNNNPDNKNKEIIVAAFIEKTNTNSVRNAEAAGFVLKKESVSWLRDEEPVYNLYVVDWNKLLEKINQKTGSAIYSKMFSLAQINENIAFDMASVVV